MSMCLEFSRMFRKQKKNQSICHQFLLTLCHCLKKCGKDFTGTQRKNRFHNYSMQDCKVFVEKERGIHDYIITKDISAIKWKDNKAIWFILNFYCMQFMALAKCWCQKSIKKINLPQRGIIGAYDKKLSRVDLSFFIH